MYYSSRLKTITNSPCSMMPCQQRETHLHTRTKYSCTTGSVMQQAPPTETSAINQMKRASQ